MTTPGTLTTAILLIAGFLPLAAKADPPASRPPDDADGTVVVIRGSQKQVRNAPQKSAGQRSYTIPRTQMDQGVIVMRPASGSFMRETTRLASEAEAREARAAREEARAKDLQLIKTLQAVEDAARAAEEEARTRSERYYMYVPRPHPPKVRPPTDGAIDP
jgi:hypothetical protein